jgi:hypothetical protein
MSKRNFGAMSQQELHDYVLAHRDETDAFFAYVDKIHAEGHWVEMPPVETLQELENYSELTARFRNGSSLNLQSVSRIVTTTINQLPDSADRTQPTLKELLTQLQQAIESEAELPDVDKADLLEQVKVLAEVLQTQEPAQKEGMARRAKKLFEATLKSLPDTAKIVEACSKVLPLILKALGLSV